MMTLNLKMGEYTYQGTNACRIERNTERIHLVMNTLEPTICLQKHLGLHSPNERAGMIALMNERMEFRLWLCIQCFVANFLTSQLTKYVVQRKNAHS